MIGFYFTKSGEYNPESIEDISNALILDDKNKKMEVMGEYEFDFQRLDSSYTSKTDSSSKALSIYGAGLMYNDLLERIDEGSGPAIDRIETSLGYISSSIGRIDISINNLEYVIDNLDYDYVKNSSLGIAGGVATLDNDGRVPSSQLPAFVDDIVEGYKNGDSFYEDSEYEHLITPSGGKIYVDLITNTSWRWGGSAYVQVSESLALGETEGTAYEGSKGAATTSTVNTHVANTEIHITSDERAQWNNASTLAHSHSNKDVLDGISSTDITNWNDASAKKHEHDNKAVLDGISSTDITNWNDASAKKHNHDNKAVLDGISATDITNWNDASAKRHVHDNKVVLDGISSTDITNWNDASAKRHVHDNKTVLDGISAANITAWNKAEENVNPNWNATSGDASILNRPTLGTAAAANTSTGIASGSQSGDLPTSKAVATFVEGKNYGTVKEVSTGDGLTGGPITVTGKISLSESGATAGRYGQTSNASVNTNGGTVTVNIPDVTVDKYGRITSISNKTLKVTDVDTTYETGTKAQLDAGSDTTGKLWDASTISQYVNSTVSSGVKYKGDFTASGDGAITGGTSTLKSVAEKVGDLYIVSTAGTYLNTPLQVGDSVIFKKAVAAGTSPTTADLTFVQGTVNVIDKNTTLAWNTSTAIAEVEGVSIHVKMPAQPTKSDLGLGNVENKSSATIRGELTAANVSTALTYIPASKSDLNSYVKNSSIATSVTDTDSSIPTSKAVKSFVEGKGYTTNTGTVTSVGISVPTGLSVTGTPVTTSGTIAVSMASGYSIPKDASLNDFQANKHSHSNKTVLDGISAANITAWNKAEENVNPNWNATSGDASILNRPTLGTAAAANISTGIAAGSTSGDLPTAKAVASFVEGKGYTTNTGTVTSVGVSVPTGLSVTGTPVTTSGTIAVSMASGYSIPKDASLNNFQTAYSNSHTHSNKSVLDGITSTNITNWNKAEENVNPNWNATSGDASILNRPNVSTGIAAGSTSGDLPTAKAVATFVEGKGYTTNTGTVTSVGMTVPTGLSVSGSPVTTSGTLAVSLTSGYSIPKDASLNNFQTAYTNSHTHSNKSVLDGITSTDITNWNDASTKKHTHSNKSVLDGITSTDITNWNDASTKKHTHSNSAILNGITDASITAWKANTTYKFTIGSTTKGDTNGTDLGTLKSETAAASGTTLSLVTTGEKATWNAKQNALTNPVTGSSLTANAIVVGNGTTTVKTSSVTISTSNPSSGSNDTTVPTSKAVWNAISNGIATADAMVYKGTIAGGSTGAYGALTVAASKGETYKVTTAGKIDGIAVEIGDMIICNTDNTAAATTSNYATIAKNWDFIQTNIDGAVVGPASSTDAHIAVFNGATGKVIKDSGYTIATSVPSNAKFTDNTYKFTIGSTTKGDTNGTDLGTLKSETAAASGTTLSLVTTGEKATWNAKQDALTNPVTGSGLTASAIVVGNGTTTVKTSSVTIATSVTNTDSSVPTSKAVASFVEGKGYTTNTGTVTSVGMTVPTGLSVSGSPVATSGTLAVSLTNGYKIPLDASLNNFQTAYSNSHTHSNSSILNGITDSSVTEWKTNTAQLQVSDTTNRRINSKESTTNYIQFTGGINKFTITDGSKSFDVAITPSIDNNVTGSGLTADNIVLGNNNSTVKTSSKTISTSDPSSGSNDTTVPTSKAVWSAISGQKHDGISGGTINRFGTCDIAAATPAKTVAVTSGTFNLEVGASVRVKFTYANTANNPTLKVGSTTAKNIFHNGARITTGYNKALLAGVCDFVYDGTQFHLVGNYTVKQDGISGATINRFGTCSIAATTAAKTVAVTSGTFSLEAGASVIVQFTNANTADNPTLNVGGTGAKNIYYKGVQITNKDTKKLLANVCSFVYDGTQYQLIHGGAIVTTKVSDSPEYYEMTI